MISDVETCSNYVEKYVPMHLQRSITHILAFVFPGRDTAWRLNWYNELRMPILSAALLTDEGKHNLREKMQELVSMLQKTPTTIMELNPDSRNSMPADEMLKDEKLL